MAETHVVRVSDPDQERAAREHEAQRRLLAAGAASLPRAPWLHRSQPPAPTDLVRFALWRDQAGTIAEDEVEAALTLLPAARAEVRQLETAVLFTARAQGMSWTRIATAMGLRSAQAAQQRLGRLSGTASSPPER